VIRAVLDPGVLIAALIAPRGACADILRAWQQGLFELVVSPLLIDELTTTLLRPKFRRWLTENDAVTFVEVLRLTARVEQDLAIVDPISRDPDDDYLIAITRSAGAHVLVSGDDDLLSLELSEPPIVGPSRFLASFSER
jgi:uncharacterized protein